MLEACTMAPGLNNNYPDLLVSNVALIISQ